MADPRRGKTPEEVFDVLERELSLPRGRIDGHAASWTEHLVEVVHG